MSKANGDAAFPFSFKDPDGIMHIYSGMTLRDYFAAKALEGYWAQPNEALPPNRSHAEHRTIMCRDFYAWADDMLAERAK